MKHTSLHRISLTTVACASVALIAPLPRTQGTAVVPPAYATKDAPSLWEVAGFVGHMRQQILVAGTWLKPLGNHRLTGISFRRDVGNGLAFKAAAAQLDIFLSVTQRDPNDPSEIFSRNRGSNPVKVFSGRVALPASPKPSSSSVPWDALNSVHIPFSTPFQYGSGNLCIEILGKPVPGPGGAFWMIDAANDGVPGTALVLGRGCGRFAGASGRSAWAKARGLRIGATTVLMAWAQPRTPAVLLVGMRPIKPPLNLGPLGAPGCMVRVAPAVTIATTYQTTPWTGGMARLTLKIPVSQSLMRKSFVMQWVDLETSLPRSSWSNRLGITTSNALLATVSSSPPTLGISTIATNPVFSTDPLPGGAETDVGAGPVIRFDFR